MRVRIADINLDYEDTDPQSPARLTVLFIHGYPLSRKLWEPQIKGLAGFARLLALDLRGFGRSEATPGPYSMEHLADDCIAFLDQLGITHPVILCGLSMGGYITFALYRKYTQRVLGIILSSTRAGADSPEARVNRDKAISVAEKEGIEGIVQLMLPKMLAPNTYLNHPELVDRVRSIMRDSSVPGITGVLAGMRDRPDSTNLLSQITVPTLMIFGDQDQFVNNSEVKAMRASIKDVKLYIISNAGHLLNLEQPNLYNEHLSSFLKTFRK